MDSLKNNLYEKMKLNIYYSIYIIILNNDLI